MKNALKDGRLKFADKKKPRPEEDFEKKVEDLFVVPVEIKVVDTIDEAGAKDNSKL